MLQRKKITSLLFQFTNRECYGNDVKKKLRGLNSNAGFMASILEQDHTCLKFCSPQGVGYGPLCLELGCQNLSPQI